VIHYLMQKANERRLHRPAMTLHFEFSRLLGGQPGNKPKTRLIGFAD